MNAGLNGRLRLNAAAPPAVAAPLVASTLASRLQPAPRPSGCRRTGSGPSAETVWLKPTARNANPGPGGRLEAPSWNTVPSCGLVSGASAGVPALPAQPAP